jgi:SAM-dependent methyltransferase
MTTAHPPKTAEAPTDPWLANAVQWSRVGPPLRPVAEDVDIVQRLATELHASRQPNPLRVLVLGVTPEIGTLPWPQGTELLAVDRSPGMLQHVWPRAGLPERASALQGDWRRLPVGDGSFDLIAGDGCYSLLPFPEQYRIFGTEMRRALAPGGRFAMRAFVRPEAREGLGAIGEDLWAGRIGNFHVFKWRLAMAVQPSTEEAVRLGDLWDAWRTLCDDPAALAERLGWPMDVVTTIDAYRGVDARYNFPTLAELRAIASEHFTEVACHVPSYELGERCPTLVFAAR